MVLAYKNNLMYSNKVDSSTERKGGFRPPCHNNIVRMNTTEVFMIKKVCPVCGKEFSANRNSTTYCSKTCFYESQKKYRICPTCGKQFNPHSSRQIYCSISCGVHSRDRHLEGQKFGRWTILKKAEKHPKTGSAMWLCRCECGTEKVVSELSLIKGQSKSCGCLHLDKLTTHNKAYTRIYNIWGHMKDRCNREKSHAYKNYGGRGVKVCDEWADSFENFYDWAMNNGYEDNLTLDRIDVNGNYEPANCRFITMKEQNRNKRNCKIITYKNEKHCISEWAEIYNIDRKKLEKDIRKGLSLEEVLRRR